MLTQMRNASKGWLATVLVGLLILAFGTWGISGVFLPSPSDAVAKVGDAKIERGDFIREFSFTLDVQSRQRGERLTPQDASRMGLDKLFLEQMITRTAYDVVVDKLDLTTPDSALLDIITNNEAFQGLTGEFDPAVYREVLGSARLSQQLYEESVRTDMARQQLANAITGGIKLPRGMIEALYKQDAERRSAKYLVLQPELAGAIPEPDKEELKKFHEAHAARYTAPEMRGFTYVLLRPEDLLDDVEVPDEEVQHEYEARKQQYVKPETRRVRQITYTTRDEAFAALQKIAGGTGFMSVAKEKGLSEDEAEMGDLRKDQFLDPAVAEAAFALETPGMTGVIEGEFGFVIAQVVSITPSTTQSLAEVRTALQKRIGMNAAAGKVEEMRADFEDALAAQSGTLEEITERLGLDTVTVEPVDQTGHTADGKRPDTLPKAPDVLRAAFVNEEGEDLGFERLSTDGYFVVRIDKSKPSELRPLDEIAERITADWKADQIHQRLEKLAGTLANRAAEGEDLAAMAGEFNLSVLTTEPPVRRNGSGSDMFSKQVLEDLFAAKPGETVSGQVRNGESFIVATLTDILTPDVSSARSRAALNSRLSQFDQEYGLALADQYALALRQELGVKRYEDVLAQAVANAR